MSKNRFSMERNGDGIRYVKRFQKKRYRSKTYHADTRDNEREAWKDFQEWKRSVPVIKKQTAIDLLQSTLNQLEKQWKENSDKTPNFVQMMTGEIDSIETKFDNEKLPNKKE